MNKFNYVNSIDYFQFFDQYFWFVCVDVRGQREKELFYESVIEKNIVIILEEIRVINVGLVSSIGTQYQ